MNKYNDRIFVRLNAGAMFQSALTRMAAPSAAYATCRKSTTKQAQRKTNPAVAGYLDYSFTKKKIVHRKARAQPEIEHKMLAEVGVLVSSDGTSTKPSQPLHTVQVP